MALLLHLALATSGVALAPHSLHLNREPNEQLAATGCLELGWSVPPGVAQSGFTLRLERLHHRSTLLTAAAAAAAATTPVLVELLGEFGCAAAGGGGCSDSHGVPIEDVTGLQL